MNLKSYLFKSYLIVALCPFSMAWGQAQTSAGHWAAGLTEPILDVTISASAAGTISHRFFREGEFVKQGQVILELDKQLEELTVMRRKLVMDTLKPDLEGMRKLYEKTQSVSKDDLDKKELEYRVSIVDYQIAEEQLRRRQLISSLDGFITDYYLEVGEDCRAQDALVRVVDTRRCYFVSNVEAKSGHGLKTGQKVKLEIESGASTVGVEGQISYVSPVVDPASGLMKIKVLFENPDGKIRPGVAGKLFLETPADVR